MSTRFQIALGIPPAADICTEQSEKAKENVQRRELECGHVATDADTIAPGPATTATDRLR